ncbi:nucleotide sugar dehydrogenase [Microbacterium foliorum]|uniref:nucleotide sugar dehydrogenase n=1 Tax=Microbacterium foliorum TaxID=104336 RepID=UPI0028D3101C|nr:nucleotide sugar dehydrogenase [Microbacterium foliorum]
MISELRAGTGAKDLVVIGQGYVGLTLSVHGLKAGLTVLGVEPDHHRFERLRAGDSYVDDIDDAELLDALESSRYHVVRRLDPATRINIAVIAVPTPLHEGSPDITAIVAASQDIAPCLRRGSVVILESTTYPGTTEEVIRPILEAGSGLIAEEDFFLGYSPERIDPGNEQWGLDSTPKLVSGIGPRSLEKVSEFYGMIVREPITVSGTREAELAKLVENSFRFINIAFANEVAIMADSLGIDGWEAIRAAGTKPFGFMEFLPGPGTGGHCLPVDPIFLSWRSRTNAGQPMHMIETAKKVNDYMPHYVVERLLALLEDPSAEGKRVLLWGLSYKADSSDLRESPGLNIAVLLRNRGFLVSAIDHWIDERSWPDDVHRVTSVDESYDAGIVVTDHSAFEWHEIGSLPFPVLDTRHRASGDNVTAL